MLNEDDEQERYFSFPILIPHPEFVK